NGKPDLIVANSNSNTISVLRNTSTPGFISLATHVDYPVGNNPWGVAMGDLDGDGKPDIATANYLSNSISLLRNRVSPVNIYSFSPTSAGAGSMVSITGSGFTGVTAVNFGGVPASSFTVLSPNNISAVVGAGATGNLSVTTVGATALLEGFIFVPAPAISSFSPTTGGPGATVTIKGKNFGSASAVSFAGTPAASFSVLTDSTITAAVGTGATGNLSVTTVGGTAVLGGFTFNSNPTITSFSPSTTGIGSTVTILGTNFIGTTAVSFGGTPADSFTVVSYNSIIAVVGAGASGNISVTNPTGTAIVPGFIFNSTPVIISFTPVTAGAGSVVTLSGNYFTGATAVNFGGVPASSFTVISSKTITAEVGASVSGNVSVTTKYGTGSLGGFTFTNLPTISFITPTTGGLGTIVAIHGTNLSSTASVNFGLNSVPFTVISESTITATVGTIASGIIPVSVTTSFGTASFAGFIAKPINIVSFSPQSGAIGTMITITGSNFNPLASRNIVYFGAERARVTGATTTTLTVTAPNGLTYQPLSVTDSDNYLTAYAAQPFIGTFTGDTVFKPNSFAASINVSGGNYPSGIFLSDVDGDGKPDMIVANINGN
ncbi:MAG TPA: IPT/TIG domain-containing protein, partial [Puia sp.]|nr:IPT/TIG domain-containing protein [Puia sp.]